MPHPRWEQMSEALKLEQKAEEENFRKLSADKSISQKVSSGICWHPVQLNAKRFTIGELLELELERVKQINSPHKLKTGMKVIIYQTSDDSKEYAGTVSYVKRNILGVILNSDHFAKSSINENGHFTVELVYDERPYRVMQKALKQILSTKDRHIQELRQGVESETTLDYYDQRIDNFQNKALNESQNDAVNGALSSKQMCIIHGPPGTGKTTTLVSAIKTLSKTEKKILVCAPSNNAVDLLARQLEASGVKTLRVGNVTRIGDNIAHLTLAEKARNHSDWAHIKKVKIEAAEAKRQAKNHKRSFGHQERRFRNDMFKESRELMKWARDLEDKLTEQIILDAQAICTTLIGVSARALDGIIFDTVVIDEASQALELESWNAILKAKKVILAGDHYQLPPTVKSQEAKKLGLEETLLDRMAPCIAHSYMLEVQYRMNNKILGFSNQQFYNNKLRAHDSVATHRLDGDDQALVYIDTAGCGFEEQQNNKNLSRYNEGEYFIIREHLIRFVEIYRGNDIGIISPYAEQVRFIRKSIADDDLIRPLDIETNSIDGFQGQEKDIIIISFVRSNERGEIGFLQDYRRLNVAITRARKKLIIIGDSATLAQHKLYADFVDHLEKEGLYESAWAYMN